MSNNNSSDNSDDSRSENSDNSDDRSDESQESIIKFSEEKLVPSNQIEINLNNNFDNSLNKKSKIHGVSFGTGFKTKGSNAFQKSTLSCLKSINNDLDKIFEDLSTKIPKKNHDLNETNNKNYNLNKISEINKLKTDNELFTGTGLQNTDYMSNKLLKTQNNNYAKNSNQNQNQNVLPIQKNVKEDLKITKTENFDINQIKIVPKNDKATKNEKNQQYENRINKVNEEKINFENIDKIINKNKQNEFKYNSSFKYKNESDLEQGNIKYLRSVNDLYKGSTGIKPSVPIAYDKKKNEFRPKNQYNYKQNETNIETDIDFSKNVNANFNDYEKKVFDTKYVKPSNYNMSNKQKNIELDLDKMNSKVEYEKYKEYMNQIKPKNIDQAINILLNN